MDPRSVELLQSEHFTMWASQPLIDSSDIFKESVSHIMEIYFITSEKLLETAGTELGSLLEAIFNVNALLRS